MHGNCPKNEVIQTIDECKDLTPKWGTWLGTSGNKTNLPAGCLSLCSSGKGTGKGKDCSIAEWKEVLFNSILDPSATNSDSFPVNAAGICKRK